MVITIFRSRLRPENQEAYQRTAARMDELAHKLKIDPVELRLRNWADEDPKERIPWTTRRLREAYAAGAEAFGWASCPNTPNTVP